MSIKDGGPAFGGTRMEPTGIGAVRSHREVTYPGMAMRDWFAGQALNALIGNGHDMPSAVEYAYSAADAMLAERAKQESADD